jgi:hypothetical protein
MAEYELYPGEYSEVMDQIKKDFDVVPVGLWRGMWPLSKWDFLECDRIKVQLRGMYTTTLRIGDESIEVFPESFQEMYEALQFEYRWGDLVFTNQKAEFISEGTPLEGEVFRVREVIHRVKCATVQFPGEPAWVTIYEELGQDIKKVDQARSWSAM